MGLGNISRTASIDVMDIVSKTTRNKRSHGKRINRNKRKHHRRNVSISDLLKIFQNNGRYNLLCTLGSIPATKLNSILEECNSISVASPKYEVALIISAFCYHKLFPKIDKQEDHKRYFLKLKYINKGIDLIDISNIFRNPSVQKLISPENFDNTEPPIVSYVYKKPSRSLIFNYNTVSSDLNIEENAPLS